MARNGNRFPAAEALHLQGELALAQDSSATLSELAADHFTQALELARQQGARALELRAAISLSRLWARGGQARRSIELLAPLWAGFAEGADTADLLSARALLAELLARAAPAA